MEQQDITYDEWRKAIETAGTINDLGCTAQELVQTLKINLPKVQNFLREGVKSGKIKLGERYIPKDWDGRARHYTVYILS